MAVNTTLIARNLILTLCAAFIVTGCSTTSETQESDDTLYVGQTPVYDPFESTNRAIFAFNNTIDNVLIHPIVETYRFVFPEPVRKGFSNVLVNLKSPVTFANQLLQGDLEGAGDVVTRASVNTLIGVGGIFDVAGHEGIEYEPEDFGQTLAVWGVPNGPYLVVPILGPSTLRDYVGYFVDMYSDPLNLYLRNIDEDGWVYARAGANYLVLRDNLMDVLKELEESSVDYYAAGRSTYYQHRNALIKDRSSGDVDGSSYPDFDNYDD